jgi:hypothetical protein
MKTILQVLSIVSLFASSYEIYKGRTDGATFFLLWSIYLRYLSDKRE